MPVNDQQDSKVKHEWYLNLLLCHHRAQSGNQDALGAFILLGNILIPGVSTDISVPSWKTTSPRSQQEYEAKVELNGPQSTRQLRILFRVLGNTERSPGHWKVTSVHSTSLIPWKGPNQIHNCQELGRGNSQVVELRSMLTAMVVLLLHILPTLKSLK